MAVTRAAGHAGLPLQEPLTFGLAIMQINGNRYLMILSQAVEIDLRRWQVSVVMIYRDDEPKRYGRYVLTPSGVAIRHSDWPENENTSNSPEIAHWENKIKLQTRLLDELLESTSTYSMYQLECQFTVKDDFRLTQPISNRFRCWKLFEQSAQKCLCMACQRPRAGWLQTNLGSCITKIIKTPGRLSDKNISSDGHQIEIKSHVPSFDEHASATTLEKVGHVSVPVDQQYSEVIHLNDNGNKINNVVFVNHTFGAGLSMKRHSLMSSDPNYQKYADAWYRKEEGHDSQGYAYTGFESMMNFDLIHKFEATLDPTLLNSKFLSHIKRSLEIKIGDSDEFSSYISEPLQGLYNKILNVGDWKWANPRWPTEQYTERMDQYFHSKWLKNMLDDEGARLEWDKLYENEELY
ncbi:hypothetical protein BGW37DRAFT_521122 [Umbelopsis sp. PMI_123]|nr:hypothetical protein BGW37DRAFT_521122 [Umbelopsis sp. PMI_123]